MLLSRCETVNQSKFEISRCRLNFSGYDFFVGNFMLYEKGSTEFCSVCRTFRYGANWGSRTWFLKIVTIFTNCLDHFLSRYFLRRSSKKITYVKNHLGAFDLIGSWKVFCSKLKYGIMEKKSLSFSMRSWTDQCSLLFRFFLFFRLFPFQ